MILQGIFHAHSGYSHDGKLSLEEIGRFLRNQHLDCVFLSEHYEDFDEIKMRSFEREVDLMNRKSDFLFIPGFEINFKEVHILVFGLKEYKKFDSISIFFDYLKKNKSLTTILAHPTKIRHRELLKYSIEHTDGFEIWNRKQDGKYFNYSFLKKIRDFDNIDNKIKILGLDFHESKDFKTNIVIFDVQESNIDNMIYALKQNHFCNSSQIFGLSKSENSLDVILDSANLRFKAKFFPVTTLRFVASKSYKVLKPLFGKQKLERIKNDIKRGL